jgi:hypothetical protein
MFPRVLVCGYFRADRMKPFVTVSVIEVPMRVNQVSNWIAAEGIERIGDPSSGGRDTGIDEKFSVAAGEHGNISARTFKNADIATQLRNSNLRAGSRVSNGNDWTFGGGEQSARH